MPNSKIWSLRLERQGHPFHIVNRSPWPFFISIAALSVTTGAVLYMHRYEGGGSLLFWGIFFLSAIMWFWFRDIVLEGTLEGQHTKKVQAGLRLGMKLFITTEIMFFFSFFWAFFHSALAPHTFVGVMWPPKGIIPMYLTGGAHHGDIPQDAFLREFLTMLGETQNHKHLWPEIAKLDPTGNTLLLNSALSDYPYWIRIPMCANPALKDNGFRWAFCYLPLFNSYSIPLAATFILLSSGLTLHIAGMWFNYANTPTLWPFNNTIREKCFQFGLTMNKTKETINVPSRSSAFYAITFWLSLTIFLGLIFTAIQAYEYIVLLPFAINDSVFGSCFYMLTGFHGFHVILGTIGLIVCLYRHMQCHFTKTIHVGFECAAWYWHFVDGVWLFVYSIIYWWSAPLKKPYLWINNENEPFSCGTRAWTWEQINDNLMYYADGGEGISVNPAGDLINVLLHDYLESEVTIRAIGNVLDLLMVTDISFEDFDKIDFDKMLLILQVYRDIITDIEVQMFKADLYYHNDVTDFQKAFVDMMFDEVTTYEESIQMLIIYRKLFNNPNIDLTAFIFPTNII